MGPRVLWEPGRAVGPGCTVGGPRAIRAVSFDQRLGASARCVALMPSYGCQPAIPHVIPRRLIQTLNLHRWNCNVFGASRKMTAINYVRNLAGGGVGAARFGRPRRDPSAPRASIGASARCPARPCRPRAPRPACPAARPSDLSGAAARPCGPSGALHARARGGFALHEALWQRAVGVSEPHVVQFPRLVKVLAWLWLVWCPKCRPPRRKTVKTGCCGRSGLRFGHNSVWHGVLFARKPLNMRVNPLMRT